MHNGLKITTKVNSNPFSQKSPITNWISIISKNFYDFLVDTNENVLLFAEEVIYFFRKRSLSSVRIQGMKLK